MENKFRSVCELCTAITFTAFLISMIFYFDSINLYACMCSALIALFTLLANRASDKEVIKKGIGASKNSYSSKAYRLVSKIRLWIETFIAGFAIFLVLAYFLTHSNQGDIFEQIAYYEAMICIGAFAIAEWFLFIISLILIGIEKLVFGQNTMDRLMQ